MRITLNKALSQELSKNLETARFVGNVKQALRFEAILLISEGLSLEWVANFCRNSVRNIYYWLTLFMTARIEGLRLKKPPGKKAKLSKVQKKELKEMILKSPEDFGYDSGIWTAAMVQDLIFKTFNVEYSTGYISQLLRQLGLSHKKLDAVSHKADKEQQQLFRKETFPEIVRKAFRQKAVILFQDESNFRQWSRIGYSWGEKGQRVEAKVNMTSRTQRVFGAIELSSADFIYKLTERCTCESFLDFLMDVVEKYPGRKIFMFIDNGRIHDNAAISRYLLNNRDKIELVRFPKYSPMLNPIERLWKKVKLNFMHNRYFADKETFVTTLKNALKFYQENFWEVHSVMKKMFNLAIKIEADFNKKFDKIIKLKALVS